MLITVISDTAAIRAPEIFETGKSLLDWLIDHYGDNGFPVPTRIFNGEIKAQSEILLTDFDKLNSCHSGNVYIIHNPLGLDPVTIQLIVSVVIALAVTVLMPALRIPNTPNTTNTPHPTPKHTQHLSLIHISEPTRPY